MKISDFLSRDMIKIGLESTSKKDVIIELVDILAKTKKIVDKDNIVKILMEREKLGTTGIGQGVAIPHAKTDSVKDVLAVFGISKKGVNFSSLDGEPVYIIFMFLSPENSSGLHLKVLAKASQLLKDKYFREPLKELNTVDEVIKMIKDEE
ncbi:MAG: PTS sugar transporter subunit IIA [Elusimicrobiota bacterium]|jgi:fructose-specific phosphotransferase system IIA component|nr:PTS sugar transporter subunit IIA [Elusimicrobiota bacterium]